MFLGHACISFEERRIVLWSLIILLLFSTVDARHPKPNMKNTSMRILSIECKGRLGNQLFQYTAAMGIAKSYPRTYACIMCDDMRMWEGIIPRPKVCNPVLIQTQVVRNETGFAIYDTSFTKLEKKMAGFLINGFMQSYKYIDPAGLAFNFEKHIKLKASNYLGMWKTRNTVGFHVRRGDMLKRGNMEVRIKIPDSFYTRAISHFQDRFGTDYVVVVISDDLEWCRNQPFFKLPRVVMADEFTKPVESLALMAQCEHHVVTIGTFGWWGAWLGTKAHSITLYHNEFLMTHPNHVNAVKLDDYYPPWWIEIV